MHKKLIAILLLSILCLTGCVSKAKYNELEKRVEALENNNIVQTSIIDTTIDINDSEDKNINGTIQLSQYITNYNEVETIIKDEFNSNQLKMVEDVMNDNDLASIKEFGTGYYKLLVNDVKVMVYCEDFIALRVYIRIGNDNKEFTTSTGQQILDEKYNSYANTGFIED